jgi:hypothetical protein
VNRSAQEILAERRSVIQEQRRERDQMARAMLQFQIDELDRELATQEQQPAPVQP